jgi:hypothetical protein
LKFFAIFGAAFLGIVAIIAFSMIGASNGAVRMQNNIVAKAGNVDNILSNYGQKVQEAAQVPAMQTDALKEVMRTALSARYGADGSKATMQWIQENYPGQVDPQLYRQIQQIIEAGRTDFQTAQTELIDEKRVYLTSLDTIPGGTMMKMMGYPSINVGYRGGKDDYMVIVTDRAADARATGREKAPISLTPAK